MPIININERAKVYSDELISVYKIENQVIIATASNITLQQLKADDQNILKIDLS